MKLFIIEHTLKQKNTFTILFSKTYSNIIKYSTLKYIFVCKTRLLAVYYITIISNSV